MKYRRNSSSTLYVIIKDSNYSAFYIQTGVFVEDIHPLDAFDFYCDDHLISVNTPPKPLITLLKLWGIL